MIFGTEMVFINGKTWINMKDNLLKVKNPEWEYYKDKIKMFIKDNGKMTIFKEMELSLE